MGSALRLAFQAKFFILFGMLRPQIVRQKWVKSGPLDVVHGFAWGDRDKASLYALLTVNIPLGV